MKILKRHVGHWCRVVYENQNGDEYTEPGVITDSAGLSIGVTFFKYSSEYGGIDITHDSLTPDRIVEVGPALNIVPPEGFKGERYIADFTAKK